ncbi:MAG: MG2 domain-containing protein, partial [Planctomycetota bacterium]|nr:MG2 domain-containing protein [Planctomycetota bacterium]
MRKRKVVALCLALGLVTSAAYGEDAQPYSAQRSTYQDAFKKGNFKDALELAKKLSLSKDVHPKLVTTDIRMAVQGFQRITKVNEIDAFLEKVLKTHPKNWRVKWEVAKRYSELTHYGYIVAGKFQRGYHRGGGRYVYSYAYDRVRSMQLMDAAQDISVNETDRKELAQFYIYFSNVLASGRGSSGAWKLQYLTDLSKTPDFSRNYNYYGGGGTGAPVDKAGNPVYHKMPKSYKAAKTDGERWRWLLLQTKELDSNRAQEVDWRIAEFAWQQFGVQTMRYYGQAFMKAQKSGDSGVYSLHTLKESETIARLASGVKRFKLHPDYDYVKILRLMCAKTMSGYGNAAAGRLAQIFENRRQYPKAAGFWQMVKNSQRLSQIVNPWCQLNGGAEHVAGKGATINLRFRNGKKVNFTAKEIKVEKLFADLKTYIKSKPKRIDWYKVNLGNVGYRIVNRNEKEYVGETTATWSLDLNPLAQHFDKEVTVTTPLQKPGAYLLEAKMDNGNTSRVIIWVNDTVMIKKTFDNEFGYYVADSKTGKPVAKANIEFFGYRQQWKRDQNKRGYYEVTTSSYAENSNAEGWAFPAAKDLERNFQWLAIARQGERLAFMGFNSVWYGQRRDQEYSATKIFGITDRPVYRPKHKVNVKFWVRQAKYDKPDNSAHAGKSFVAVIYSPKGEKIYEKSHKADNFGGIQFDYTLPKDAALGSYNCYIKNMGGYTRFRVEEYKKPEFQVTVEAPTVPVQLGEKITAKIVAKYFFGAPVVKAKVKYKVLRTSKSAQWYPGGYWDWFYGPG